MTVTETARGKDCYRHCQFCKCHLCAVNHHKTPAYDSYHACQYCDW